MSPYLWFIKSKAGTGIWTQTVMKVLNHTSSLDQLGRFIKVAVVISDLGKLQLRDLIETKLPPNQDFYVDFINEYKSGEKMYHIISPKSFELK